MVFYLFKQTIELSVYDSKETLISFKKDRELLLEYAIKNFEAKDHEGLDFTLEEVAYTYFINKYKGIKW